ncbi:MAG: DUF192 domain-containing protein [Anaerolineaceae bacterium]|nr:DUF192 domain-containing protein [Anaerolineaceae bacterium]
MKLKERIIVYKNDIPVAEVKRCDSSLDTGIGLLGTPELNKKNGIHDGILMPIPEYRKKFKGFINSIHMIGMKYPISVFWLDEEGFVVDSAYAVPGFHIYSPKKPSANILELDRSAIDDIQTGDRLELR